MSAMSRWVVHYKEIAIKGDNRVVFERRLADNLRRALAAPKLGVRREFGRLVVEQPPALPAAEVEARLARVPGIGYFAEAAVVPRDLEAMAAEAVRLSTGLAARTFRIRAKRSDKRFPQTSVEIGRVLGAAVNVATGMGVDLEQAEHTVHVEVTDSDALLYSRRIEGIGGLPVGTAGKVVVLLSGGIDSPVAAFRLIRRGCRAVLLHFHNYQRYQEEVRAKIRELAAILDRFQLGTRLYVVPFADVQTALLAAVPPPLRMVSYRRMMLRIGEGVLERERARAFVTGDSLGQVASQTLENLQAIQAVARHPIFTPLIGDDKDDIVAQARRIGTYDVSIRPYEDCCSFLVPRHPDTRVEAARLAEHEARIPVEALAKAALDAAEVENW